MNWRKIFNNLPNDEHFEMLMEMYAAKKNITTVVLFRIGGYKITSSSRKETKSIGIQFVVAIATFWFVDLYFKFFRGVEDRPTQIGIVVVVNMTVYMIIRIKNKNFLRFNVREKA